MDSNQRKKWYAPTIASIDIYNTFGGGQDSNSEQAAWEGWLKGSWKGNGGYADEAEIYNQLAHYGAKFDPFKVPS